MNLRLFPAVLTAGVMALFAFANNARADTITYTQDFSDFASLSPSASTGNPAAASSTLFSPILFGSVPNVDRSPFENLAVGVLNPNGNGGFIVTNWDQKAYSAVQGGGSVTYNLGLSNTLSILWGSADSYNTLTFYNGSTLVGSLTGTGVTTGPATFNPLNGLVHPQTYGHDLIVFTDSGVFTSVVLTSSQNAFEFADLSAGLRTTQLDNTPLPAALQLFASGRGAFGLIARRRKRK